MAVAVLCSSYSRCMAAVAPSISSKVVCVTGAGGFLGSHVVAQLLRRGHTVRAAVRNPADAKNSFFSKLPEIAAAPIERLTVVEGDLMKPGSYDAAFAGCETVIHTAAVVKFDYNIDPMAEIVNPTVEGIKNVIGSAKKAGIKRIVHTSSSSTIQGVEGDRAKECQGKMFTEAEFGMVKKASPTWGTYGYSKTLAEKALDELWDGEYAVFYPVIILGPGLNDSVKSSLDVIKMCVTREYPVAPKMYTDWVDVRDVAAAHVAAAEMPSEYVTRPPATAAVARPPSPAKFILAQKDVRSIAEFSAVINKRFPKLNCPETATPHWALWCLSFIDRRVTPDLLEMISLPSCAFDNAKVQRPLESGGLGFTFQHNDLSQSLHDTVEAFYKLGIVKGSPS